MAKDSREYPDTPVTFKTEGKFIKLLFPQPVNWVKLSVEEAEEFKRLLDKCIEAIKAE